MEEIQLINKIKAGDIDAFDAIYEKYKERIYKSACLICGSEADGDDVSQETWITVFRRIQSLKNPEKFVPWLYQIMKRCAFKKLKANGSEISFDNIPETLDDTVISGSVGYAAGKADLWVSWGGSDYSTDFSDLEKSASAFDESTVLKEFSNGFAFKGFSNGGSAVKDADGNTLGEGSRMDVTYSKDGIDIMYTVEKGGSTVYDDIASGAAADFTNGDIKYYFHELKNKFVPTNYEMTAEEEALVESGELNVGYGSDKVEEKISQSIYWEKDGNIYSLFGFDTGLSANDFFKMAKELN